MGEGFSKWSIRHLWPVTFGIYCLPLSLFIHVCLAQIFNQWSLNSWPFFQGQKMFVFSTVIVTFKICSSAHVQMKEKSNLTFTGYSYKQASLKPACGINTKVIFLNVNAKAMASSQWVTSMILVFKYTTALLFMSTRLTTLHLISFACSTESLFTVQWSSFLSTTSVITTCHIGATQWGLLLLEHEHTGTRLFTLSVCKIKFNSVLLIPLCRWRGHEMTLRLNWRDTVGIHLPGEHDDCVTVVQKLLHCALTMPW